MTLRIFTLIATACMMVTACADRNDLPLDKQLAQLRSDRLKIDEEIRSIEAKLGTGKKKAEAQPVTVLVVNESDFQHLIDVKGTVDSRSTVHVAPQTGGRIVAVNVMSGQAVTRGKVLYELDAELVRKGIEEVKVQLEFAKTLYEKQKRIYDQKAGSEIQYLTAKNQVETLERRLESLNEQLALTRVVAPVSGFADNVTGKLGEMAVPGMPLVTVVNTSDMRVVVDLAESFVSTVTNGDAVKVYFPEINDSVVTTINVVSKSVNPLSRTFRVEIPVRRVPANLRPNSTCRVVITDQMIPKAMAVPVAAVLQDNQGSYVFVYDGSGVARRRTIVTGIASNGMITVTSGLTSGESIIVRGAMDIADGQIVRNVN